jgi:hypothetical protein
VPDTPAHAEGEAIPMQIAKIVSGGQTGADRGGWDAALYCEIPIGGWIPLNRLAEDGAVPAKYTGVQQTTSKDYLVRTEANVADSDATVIFCYGPPTGGSKRTIAFAIKHHRPHLAVNLSLARKEVVAEVVRWLKTECTAGDASLNVAGTRGSKAPGIQQVVMARMIDVISEVNGKLFYPLADEG